MNSPKSLNVSRLIFASVFGAAIMAWAVPASSVAQDKTLPPDQHSAHVGQKAVGGDESLVQQIEALRVKVAALETALAQKYQGTPSTMLPASGKGMMKGGGVMGGKRMGMMGRMPQTPSATDQGSMNMPANQGMGMMGGMGATTGAGAMPAQPGGGMMMEGEGMGMMGGMGMSGMGPTTGSGSMPSQPGGGMMMEGEGMGMGGMSGGMGMMDMDMMGMMGQNPAGAQTPMGRMAILSALPGFPGASHLYHVGVTGFFLNHRQHITLTNEQKTQLNRIKEQALLAQAESQRKIDQGEQELWQLTSADQPDAAKIEGKVREIEKLRGDQRLAFIHSVGEAAKMLMSEQITSLVGQAPPAGQTPMPQHQP